MPTYRNDGTKSYLVGNVEVNPGEEIKTVKILDISGFTKISEEPYYNPVVQHELVTFTTAETQTVVIDNPTKDLRVTIRRVVGCGVEVYFRDNVNNTPPVAVLEPGQNVVVNLKQSVDSIVLVSDASGECELIFKEV